MPVYLKILRLWAVSMGKQGHSEEHKILLCSVSFVWSEFLITDDEAPGSIPGATRFYEK
jgi:hypothetical protein